MAGLYPPESQQMDFISHLEELRRRILTCLIVLVFVSVVLFSRGHFFLSFLEKPALGFIKEFVFITPTEVFVAYLKVVLLAAFLFSFPVVLYEAWAFLAPALALSTRRMVLGWLLLALVCFFGGVIFSYSLLLPAALQFLFSFGQGLARPAISLGKYVSFATVLILAGGCIFQIPVVIGLLTEAGILDTGKLRASRRFAILSIFIVAAVVTPTQDIVNLLLFALPMVALYEVGIWIAFMIGRRKKRFQDATAL